jgi:ABC-type bacteriocin/lantibiotic exporter with double-glycine peptidase domain
LGEGGLGLSGGQKQRLAICRELFKKPELLIFDEATSSLDKHSEAMVTSVLKQLSGKITMIVVTHNPEMIDWVDNVVLLESGKVRAQGDWLRVRQGLSLSGTLS